MVPAQITRPKRVAGSVARLERGRRRILVRLFNRHSNRDCLHSTIQSPEMGADSPIPAGPEIFLQPCVALQVLLKSMEDHNMKKNGNISLSLTLGLCLSTLTATAQTATAQTVNLQSASSFAVLAGTTVTVTGAGTISGNVGIFPGTGFVAGTPAVKVNGTIYPGGAVAAQAQTDLLTAYNDAAGRSVAPVTVAGNIGGQTLAPGLYKSTSSLAISSGDLTLDARGNAAAVWIFQIASTLTTTSGRQVILAGGANPANIFWQVGSSATIGTTSVFQGTILASASISMLTGSTLTGRALAIGGAVSIDTGGGSSATLPNSNPAATGPTVISTLNGASYLPPVSAGSIAAVFGSGLAAGQASSTGTPPLPLTLAQSSVTLGGVAAPLYFVMPTQLNLQIPWEVAGQTQTSIIVTVSGAASATQTVALATFAPGIFSLDASGTGQGAILNSLSAQVARPGTPALRGGYISIYCTGLGPVANQPKTGAAALGLPLSPTLTTPAVTIGGIAAVVSYSGLAPSLTGLYQVNAVVPPGALPGSAVPVVISIGGSLSNTVTIAVQ